MKIIRRGDPDKIKVYEKECFKCQTIFEYDETEVQQENISMYPSQGTSWIQDFVVCPVCEQKLYIEVHKIFPIQYNY